MTNSDLKSPRLTFTLWSAAQVQMFQTSPCFCQPKARWVHFSPPQPSSTADSTSEFFFPTIWRDFYYWLLPAHCGLDPGVLIRANQWKLRIIIFTRWFWSPHHASSVRTKFKDILSVWKYVCLLWTRNARWIFQTYLPVEMWPGWPDNQNLKFQDHLSIWRSLANQKSASNNQASDWSPIKMDQLTPFVFFIARQFWISFKSKQRALLFD